MDDKALPSILHVDSSVRRTDNSTARYNSISKGLAKGFISTWNTERPDDEVIYRDVGISPPDFMSEAWIAAAFTPESKRTSEQARALELSDLLIKEIRQADIILISAPMYNYGLPAALKAWFDQVIRVNETFSFDLARGDFPLEPIMAKKTLVLVSSSGEFGFEPGGIREAMNHLGPHIKVMSKYLGVETFHEVRAEYQEFGDERHAQSVSNAKLALAQLAQGLAANHQDTLEISSAH
ncbi:FMN-dependent NADH-azoreductase 1 [Pseudovibrio axinellae]|uniref:FMN dependent NADH:quinone oxidoreductase n=1 Tax=Pseudovibrio axinellae TaxID=989403 RepID=A0A166B9N3_9HYPH|nr:NAD(P)H-dependent oxidoreductase [Pseudovibrio axinellae]KZL22048.1 FMN-dependent NADH-azoreductase 1 [Pseudovibrio axinellae]SEQ57255.1 FMN-dependent NADH-azoreductase [Pseudovibrio axinellae]